MIKTLLSRLLWIVVLVALGVVGVVGVQNYMANQETVDPASLILEETTVERDNLLVTISATGVITPVRQVTMFFEFVAPVTEILVQEGDTVTTGQVLARLDAGDLQTVVDSAQLALDAATAGYNALTAEARPEDIAAAEAAVASAEAALYAAYSTAPSAEEIEIARLQTELAGNQLWQLQLQRDAATGASGVPLIPIPDGASQEVIDGINAANQIIQNTFAGPDADSFTGGLNQAGYAVQIANANYASIQGQSADVGQIASANAQLIQAQVALDRLVNGPSEFDLQNAELNVAQAQLALDQAQASLERTVLVAPFDGVVAQINLVVGEVPPTQSPAMLLIDTTSYYVDLSIDETDIVRIALGQPVNVFLDALPEADVTATVTRIAVTPTVVGQLVTYPVRVTLNPTTDTVRVSMSTTARIVVNELDDVLVLRNRFIRIDRATEQAFVTIQNEDGTFQEIEIVLGLRNETFSQVISGLEVGQRVVLVPRDTLNPLG
jgi:multidrug resistance efflux pump